jgi:hypothetical protein
MRLVPVGCRLSWDVFYQTLLCFAGVVMNGSDFADPLGSGSKAALGPATSGVDDFALGFNPLCLQSSWATIDRPVRVWTITQS